MLGISGLALSGLKPQRYLQHIAHCVVCCSLESFHELPACSCCERRSCAEAESLAEEASTTARHGWHCQLLALRPDCQTPPSQQAFGQQGSREAVSLAVTQVTLLSCLHYLERRRGPKWQASSVTLPPHICSAPVLGGRRRQNTGTVPDHWTFAQPASIAKRRLINAALPPEDG